MKKVLLESCIVLLSVFVSLCFLEAGFRGYVYLESPEKFRSSLEVPNFYGLYDSSLWEFNERQGFSYKPDAEVTLTSINDGKVGGCGVLNYVNENGNIGEVLSTHEDPDFTIAVFGDSWTAYWVDGKTWPAFLKEKLEERTGKKINVINLGRDGTGIVHMMRMAEAYLPLIKPDLAIVAFITDDIDRAMFWRTETRIDGELRILTTTVPARTPPIEKSVDTMLVHEKATHEWCQNTLGKRDSLVEEIEAKYRRLLLHANSETGPPPDIFTLKHSFILNYLVNGDPLFFNRRIYRPSQNPRLAAYDFEHVDGFEETFNSVKSNNIPIKFVHFAIYPELLKEVEYDVSPQRESLLKSLELMTGEKVFPTIGNAEAPEDLGSINITADNFHPSLIGMGFYADAVSNIIMDNQLLAN